MVHLKRSVLIWPGSVVGSQRSYGLLTLKIVAGRFVNRCMTKSVFVWFCGSSHAHSCSQVCYQILSKYLQDLFLVTVEWPLAFLRSRRHHARFRRLITPTIEKRMAWKRANPTGWQQEHGLRDLLSMYVDDYLDKDCVKREKMVHQC